MVRLSGRKGQDGINVRVFKIGVFLKNSLS